MAYMNTATQDHQALEITRLRNLLVEVRTLCHNQVMSADYEKAGGRDASIWERGQDMMAEKVLDLLDQVGV